MLRDSGDEQFQREMRELDLRNERVMRALKALIRAEGKVTQRDIDNATFSIEMEKL